MPGIRPAMPLSTVVLFRSLRTLPAGPGVVILMWLSLGHLSVILPPMQLTLSARSVAFLSILTLLSSGRLVLCRASVIAMHGAVSLSSVINRGGGIQRLRRHGFTSSGGSLPLCLTCLSRYFDLVDVWRTFAVLTVSEHLTPLPPFWFRSLKAVTSTWRSS